MAATTTFAYGTIATPTFSGLNSLAAATLALSAQVSNTAGAVDFLIEVNIADIAESGNKQIIIYAISSIDGTVYEDSSVLTNLVRLGAIDMTGGTTTLSKVVRLAAPYYGVCPSYFKVGIYNDAGVSLASSGNSVRVQPITIVST